MTEQLAPGRFSWCKLHVKYSDLSVVGEDRSNGSWWDDLPKKDIIEISIIPLDNDGNKVENKRVGICKSPESVRRVGFFHFKQAKKTFGLRSGKIESKDVGCVIGMVLSSSGDAMVVRMKPDHSIERYDVNVITMNLNLEQQGIVLSEIDGE